MPIIAPKRNEQEVHNVYDVQEGTEYGSTQGRKGAKLKRINVTIGTKNREKIKKVAADNGGKSMTAQINVLIDEIRKKEDYGSDKGIDKNYRLPKGSRIPMGFSDTNYLYLQMRSKVNGISVSSLLNQFIEREVK